MKFSALSCDFIRNILRKVNPMLDEKNAKHRYNRPCVRENVRALELNCIQIYSDKANRREDNTIES